MDETFGELLKRLRHEAGFSQTELSRKSGLSISAIVKFERDDRNEKAPISLRMSTLSMLADGLGLSKNCTDRRYLFDVALKREMKKWAFLEDVASGIKLQDQDDSYIEETHPRFLP